MDLAKKAFPSLKRYGVAALLDAFHEDRAEIHRGLSDAMDEALILERSVRKWAADNLKAIHGLTVGDLARLCRPTSFTGVLESMAPLPVEPERLRDPPPGLAEEVDRMGRELSRRGKPQRLRDVAYAMGVPFDALRARLWEHYQAPEVSAADAILASLEKEPRSAVFTDFDGTLTLLRPDGLSHPVSGRALAALERHLELGVPVVVISARNFDFQPPDAVLPGSRVPISFRIREDLVDKIRPGLRRHLVFVGSLGGELVLFDRRGEPVRYLRASWTSQEWPSVLSSFESALRDSGIDLAAAEASFLRSNPSQMAVTFKASEERKAEAFARALEARLREARVPYPVHHNGNWVYVSKFRAPDMPPQIDATSGAS
jgi:hypothetical protein